MIIAVASLLLFAALLFGTALISKKIPLRNATQALVTLGSLGALSYFGLTEMIGRYGLEALLAFMAFTLVFLFSPLVMRPVHWAAQTRRLPTLADLFSYRYRSRTIGPLVTVALTLSCLPLLAGQVQLAGSSLQLISANELPTGLAKLLFALLITLLLLFFGQRATHSSRLMTTLAVGAVITLTALLTIAVWACWHYFGQPLAMQQWANANGLNQNIHRSGNSYSLISLFLLASLTLPHLYHQQSWHTSTKSRALTGWLFPLLLLITTLTMVPLFWSGLAARLPTSLSPQLFLPSLAAASQSMPLQILVTVGGLFACTTIIITTTQALVAMASSYLLPTTIGRSGSNLYQQLIRKRQYLTVAWIALALISSQLIITNSISTLTIVSLVGVAQLAPGLLSALYVPILNRRGVTAGLSVGILLWGAGLLLPLFLGSWQWALGTNTLLRFGIADWSNWLLISLTANFALSWLVTRRSKSDRKEAFYARASMIEKVSAPQRIASEQCHLPLVQQQLANCIGEVAATRELKRAVTAENVNPDSEPRPFEWRQLRSRLTANLYQLLGVIRAEQAVGQALPLIDDGEFNAGDLRSLESLLAERQQPLYGLAAELNKLRLHHKNILNELPLGACSLDRDNEIVLWNEALQNITGITANTATGSHIDALPEPWRAVLSAAVNSNHSHEYALEVANGERKVRFNLHKSIVQRHDNPFAEQVILLEDVSDVIQLTQEIAHTERLASIGRLAAGVAHEIGNPVTGIACLAQDIHSDTSDDEQRQAATMILDQVECISRIVQSLVDFSRSGSENDIQIVDAPLLEVLQQASQLLALDKDHDNTNIQIDCPKHLSVRGDTHQLVQIFLNLFSNARDASDNGDNGDAITVIAQAVEQQAEIRITDCGTGISADKLGKVLEPFFTTKPIGQGTGLGLSLVYSMVRSYGGELSLHSPVADNRGTCVTVTLPLAHQSPQQSQERQRFQRQPRSGCYFLSGE